MSLQVTILRHPVALKNLEDRHGIGSHLAPGADDQLQTICKLFRNMGQTPDHIVFTPVTHAEESAHRLAISFGVTSSPAEALRPLGFGIVAGLSGQEILERFPELSKNLADWRQGKIEGIDLRLPGAESIESFWARGITFLGSLREGHTLVITTRSTFVLLGNILRGCRPERGGGYKEIPIDNCEFFSFSLVDGQWRFIPEKSCSSKNRF